ncbi:oligosaccharide flippase family protein [Candidatus Woesearchaeota archaeon]|nr:oligosaccharide flippase family protein [Candidatus Woesearchaeota archaeon]
MDIIKKFLKYDKNDSLIRDGIILFTATMIANASGYIYHLGMGRILGPADYGALGAILSLLYILLVPFNVIQTTLSKFVAKFKANDQENKIRYLFYYSLKKLSLYGIILAIISGFFWYNTIFPFLNLKYGISLVIVMSILVFFIFLLPINRGILQGLQTFKPLGINIVIEAITKLFFGFLLVMLGFGIVGAFIGIVLSYIIPFIISLWPLKKRYLSKKVEDIEIKSIYKYSFPVLITMLSLTAFYSLDVILVKHYFNDISSGFYAAAALLGRIVFFASLSISMVMFPKVAEMDAMKKPNVHILNKALSIVALISAAISVGYFVLPKLIVMILFGSEYLEITSYIATFALLMSFFSLSYLLALYNLSVNRISFIFILLFFNIIEIVSIVLFHDSLKQVINSLTVVMMLMFILMMFYTLYRNRYGTINNNPSI